MLRSCIDLCAIPSNCWQTVCIYLCCLIKFIGFFFRCVLFWPCTYNTHFDSFAQLFITLTQRWLIEGKRACCCYENYRFTSQHLYFCKHAHILFVSIELFFKCSSTFCSCFSLRFVCFCVYSVQSLPKFNVANALIQLEQPRFLLESWFYVNYCFGTSFFFVLHLKVHCSSLFLFHVSILLCGTRLSARNEEWNFCKEKSVNMQMSQFYYALRHTHKPF